MSEWKRTAAIRGKQEGRFLKDLAKVQARIQNGRLKNDVKIGEAIGRLEALSSGGALSLTDLRCEDTTTQE